MSNYELKAVEEIFVRLLAGESVAIFENDLSQIFEFIAARLFSESSCRDQRYFDGVVGLVANVLAPRKINFLGEMWIGSGRDQWTEVFRARITDQRMTKQGFRIVMQIGEERAEGEISSLFAAANEPPQESC